MNRALDHAAVERRALRAAGDCLAEGILTHVSGYFQSRRGTRVSAYNRGAATRSAARSRPRPT
jgi:ribosomal protein S3